MILVLAGNYRQARDWAKLHGLQMSPQYERDVMYVSDIHNILGMERGHNFVRVGTWYDKSATVINRILEQFKIRQCVELDKETLQVIE